MQCSLELLAGNPRQSSISQQPRERLIDFAKAGKVIRIFSDVLGQVVAFASDNADPADLPSGVPVYYARELAALWGADGNVSRDYLRRIHEVKTTFEPAVIVDGNEHSNR